MHVTTPRPPRALRTLIGAAALCAVSMTASAQTNGNSVTLLTMMPSANGIQFGFWENQNYQYQTLATFGHRPTARVAIDSWSSIEPAATTMQPAGKYDWTAFNATTLADLVATHQYGETILGSVNVSFTTHTSGSKSTIPSSYTQDITDPVTRAAAKNFITAYVQHVAAAVGSFTLTVDYEIVSNYNLDTVLPTDNCQDGVWWDCRLKRANTWAAWFAEAALTARNAMSNYNSLNGKNFVLTIEPIVNGNVIDPSNPLNGASDTPWITKMVGASDTVAMDNYHCTDGVVVTDADGEIDAITTWNKLIGNTPKKLVVAENGFSSGLTAVKGGNVCEENDNLTEGKYKGTPAEQAAYYTDLFAKLKTLTQAGGALHGRLQSFNIWSIIDNPLLQSVSTTDSDYSFGVINQPNGPAPALGKPKPATPIVASGIASFESDSDLSPTTLTGSETWTKKLQTGAPVAFNGGADYSFLRYVGNPIGTTAAPVACYANVRIDHADPGDTLMLEIDGHEWTTTAVTTSTTAITTSIPLSPAQCGGEGTGSLQLDVYVTGSSFPATHSVSAINTTATPAPAAAVMASRR